MGNRCIIAYLSKKSKRGNDKVLLFCEMIKFWFFVSAAAKMRTCTNTRGRYLDKRVDSGKTKNGNTCVNDCFLLKTGRNILAESMWGRKNERLQYYPAEYGASGEDGLREQRSMQAKKEARHRIAEKNGGMKTAHEIQRADSVGLFAMRLQKFRHRVKAGPLQQVLIGSVKRQERFPLPGAEQHTMAAVFPEKGFQLGKMTVDSTSVGYG